MRQRYDRLRDVRQGEEECSLRGVGREYRDIVLLAVFEIGVVVFGFLYCFFFMNRSQEIDGNRTVPLVSS